jgi:hypothetical protein
MTLYNNGTFVNRIPARDQQAVLLRHPPVKKRKAKCPRGLRRRVFAAFSICEYCGADPHARSAIGTVSWPTVDRIVAGSRYEPGSVTMACLLCNSLKGTSEFIGPVRTLQIMEGGYVSTRS